MIEQFIMVATRSQLLPATPSNQPPFSSMDLGIALDITTSPPPESSTATDWQQLGEDPSIEICTVTLFYNAIQIGEPDSSRRYSYCLNVLCRYSNNADVADILTAHAAH